VAQTRDGADSASRTLGIVSPAAEEFRRLGVDEEALAGYARAGRGRSLEIDEEGEAAASVWAHDIEAVAFPTPVWPFLLLLAMTLVPIDVGVRRVALTGADLARARAWLARRVGLGRPVPEIVPGLAELRAAKVRTERRAERVVRAPQPETALPGPSARQRAATPAAPRAADPGPAEPAAATSPAPGETLAERLARQRRQR
jgi:hypothetical protein